MIMLLQWLIKSIKKTLMRTLQRITQSTLDLILYFTLYTLHFTLYTLHFTLYTLHFTLYTRISIWPGTKYPIKTESMLGVWIINCLITPTATELMDGRRHNRDKESYSCLGEFLK